MLRGGPFRWFLAAHSVSVLGDGIARVALVFAVLEITTSPTAVGLVLAAQSVPTVVLLLVSGVVGDRRSRRELMIAADAVRFAAQVGMAVLLISGEAQVWQLAVLAGAHGAATAFFNPAATALLPQTVGRAELREANGLRNFAQAAGSLLGPALAGVAVAVAGAGWALAIDGLTFAASAALLWRLPQLPHPERESTTFLMDLRGGWDEFRARDWVWGVVVGASLGNALLGVLWVLGPIITDGTLGGPAVWGLLVSALGAGSIMGGLVALRVRPRRPLRLATLAVALPATAMACVAASVSAPVTAAAMFATGFGLIIFNTLWETALQRHVPPASLSRVSAYDWFGSLALDPVGRGLAGPIAAAVGVSTTLWGAAIAYLLVVAGQMSIPGVRRLN